MGVFFSPFFYNCWVHIARAAACSGDCLATCSGMQLRGCAFLTVVEGPCQRSAAGGRQPARGSLAQVPLPPGGTDGQMGAALDAGSILSSEGEEMLLGFRTPPPPEHSWRCWGSRPECGLGALGGPGVLSPLPLPVPPSPAFILWPRFPCDSSLAFFSWLSRKSAACSAPLKISVQQRHTDPVRRAP